jgi:Na+(H+)/acetate symporter ActP
VKSLEQITIRTNFGRADWAIVFGFLVISTGLGIWARKYIRNMADYVVAGRGVKTYLGVATIIASELLEWYNSGRQSSEV